VKKSNINDNHISIGDKYESVFDSLGVPDEKYGDGEEVYFIFGDGELHTSAIENNDGVYEDLVVNLHRRDIFHTTEEVSLTLGEPYREEYDECV
jgi:hypothetical protein